MADIGYLQRAAEKGGKAVLAELKKGNKRYVDGKQLNPRANKDARDSVVNGQKPVATIVGCSDSRCPVEVMFDCGIGDLFVVRTAGHVISESSLASIEYGTEHCKTKLVVVLGHQKCGAVNAAHDTDDTSGCSKPMAALVQQIKPAVETGKAKGGSRDEIIKSATLEHVKNTINLIREKLGEVLEHLKISIVGGYYNLDTGAVDFYEDMGIFYD